MVAASTPWHSDGGDQCDLEVAQKKQEDQDCENDAYEDRIPYALFRLDNQLALVVPVCNLNVRRQLLLKLCQFSFDFAAIRRCCRPAADGLGKLPRRGRRQSRGSTGAQSPH